eukprot:UN02145
MKRTINNAPNVDACAEIHFQMNIFDSSASTNPKKTRFSSKSIFKLRSSKFKFYLQIRIQAIKLRKQEFDRLENIWQFY